MNLNEIKPLLKDTITEYTVIVDGNCYSVDFCKAKPEFKLLNAIFNPTTVLDEFNVVGVYVNSEGSGFSVDFESGEGIVKAMYEFAAKNHLTVETSDVSKEIIK